MSKKTNEQLLTENKALQAELSFKENLLNDRIKELENELDKCKQWAELRNNQVSQLINVLENQSNVAVNSVSNLIAKELQTILSK